MNRFLVVSFLACAAAKQNSRPQRNALPQEIYRENVEPAKGGKVPESAHLRAELNMIDTAGLRVPEGIEMEKMMAAMSPELPDHMLQDTMSQYNPGLTPALRLKPGYAPHPAPFSPVGPAPTSFAPAPYSPAPYSPEPVYAPEPLAYEPVGPVLLDKKPYETKTVQALPIPVSDTYTNFDCNGKYANRHYADPEAACTIYHFCHEDGKQDTFHCSYGTAFNEYVGTCDHEASVHCVTGEGYAAPAPYVEPVSYAPSPAPYHAPAPVPAPYHAPVPAPAPYVAPAPVPAPYAPSPAPYVAPAPTPYAPEPAPYHGLTPFVAHAPAPTPYQAPVTYHEPSSYAPAPTVYQEPLTYQEPGLPGAGIKAFTQF